MVDVEAILNEGFPNRRYSPNSQQRVAAINLLNELVPSKPGEFLLEHAEHELLFFGTDCKKLAEVATIKDLKKLRSYGVLYHIDRQRIFMDLNY